MRYALLSIALAFAACASDNLPTEPGNVAGSPAVEALHTSTWTVINSDQDGTLTAFHATDFFGRTAAAFRCVVMRESTHFYDCNHYYGTGTASNQLGWFCKSRSGGWNLFTYPTPPTSTIETVYYTHGTGTADEGATQVNVGNITITGSNYHIVYTNPAAPGSYGDCAVLSQTSVKMIDTYLQ